ncbi:MAG TPA: DUF4294 domain-containing protein, partial [Bacteroidales bacterium]|nr:DUF4294 domain-containing protein [Bacteroidales bacterium]
IPIIVLPEFVMFAPITFKNAADERRFNRLVRHVKKVYPYARIAGITFRHYEQYLVGVESPAERRKILREAEEELRQRYQDELMKLTYTQGRILLKLVDRETGHSSYDLVNDLRGAFRAFFWQSFAQIFGFDLKVRYDPEGADKDIERIVRMIESGAI